MAELRSFIQIDQLQPQTVCYLGTWMRGTLPRLNMAAQIIEIAPGLDIESFTDIVAKSADVKIGILVVERQYGFLEFHSRSLAEVQAASAAVLAAIGERSAQALTATVLASKIVTCVDHQQAFLINRNKLGSLLLGGQSLYLLECQPASYAILAANEAEKHANIRLIDCRLIGASGRLYLAGSEAEVRHARDAALQVLSFAGGGDDR